MIEDVLAWLWVALLCVGGTLMYAGYGILIRQALRDPQRREAFRRIWTTKDYWLLHARAGGMIYRGAAIGSWAFLLVLIWALWIRR